MSPASSTRHAAANDEVPQEWAHLEHIHGPARKAHLASGLRRSFKGGRSSQRRSRSGPPSGDSCRSNDRWKPQPPPHSKDLPLEISRPFSTIEPDVDSELAARVPEQPYKQHRYFPLSTEEHGRLTD